MTPCSLVEFSSALNMEAVRFCKSWQITTSLHGVITQENISFHLCENPKALKQKYHCTVSHKGTCLTARSVSKFRSQHEICDPSIYIQNHGQIFMVCVKKFLQSGGTEAESHSMGSSLK